MNIFKIQLLFAEQSMGNCFKSKRQTIIPPIKLSFLGRQLQDLNYLYKFNTKINNMNLLQIKEKYKQILQEPESEHSEQEWELAYSRMKHQRRRHVLTQSNCVHQPSRQTENDSDLLKLKQKLAQCLSNIHRKDKQIVELKQINLKCEQRIKGYETQINSLKQALSSQEQRIIENKIAYGCMQKDYSSLSRTIQSQKLDKELMKKQVEYFEDQIRQLKVLLSKKDIHLAQLSASIQNNQKYKAINSKMKIDIARLKQLLAETEKYRIFATDIENKHYLGKVSKEHECWFSEELIIEVEKLLRKCKIGSTMHSSKELLNIIVKFVNKFSEEEKKKVEKRAKRAMSSRVRQIQRKQNHSLNYMQVRGQTLKKSLLRSSMCRSIRSNVLNQSKKYTESFIYDKLSKSLVTHQFNQNRDLCIQMLGSFRKGMVELISCKKIKTNKLVKLVDWVIQGILSIFPKDRNILDIPIETDQIRIEA